jgi:hypothetical protein
MAILLGEDSEENHRDEQVFGDQDREKRQNLV